jgi:hypothetical protein
MPASTIYAQDAVWGNVRAITTLSRYVLGTIKTVGIVWLSMLGRKRGKTYSEQKQNSWKKRGGDLSKHRRAAKVDSNQNAIVKALRSVPGISVEVGHDDILVGCKGRTYWYEIKNPECANKAGVVFESAKKDTQKELEKSFAGHYKIVTTIEEIIDDIKEVPMNK